MYVQFTGYSNAELRFHDYESQICVAEKDWDDIKFGVDNKVDFYAVSFVKDAEVVHELKNYLKSKYLKYFKNTF